MKYFTFKGFFNDINRNDNIVFTKMGYPILVSRTGYTGEIGFELFVDADYVEDLWLNLLNSRNAEDFTMWSCCKGFFTYWCNAATVSSRYW